MSAWLDEITDQFVPVPDHFCRVVGIAENFRESVVVYGTLRIWIVNYVQALPQVGVWAMRPEIHCPVVSYPKLAVVTVDHRWWLCGESQWIVFDRKLPFKQRRNLFHQLCGTLAWPTRHLP